MTHHVLLYPMMYIWCDVLAGTFPYGLPPCRHVPFLHMGYLNSPKPTDLCTKGFPSLASASARINYTDPSVSPDTVRCRRPDDIKINWLDGSTLIQGKTKS